MERLCSVCKRDMTSAPAHRLICNSCADDRSRDPVRHRAHNAIRGAIKRGELPRAHTLVCVDCGKQARDYDHREYAKPLDVVPVCRSCNQKRGAAIDSIQWRIPLSRGA